MVKQYKKDLESSQEKLEEWKNGKVTAGERRILMTKWLGNAWDEMKTQQKMITDAFKRCGMYNALDGSERHLIKIRKFKEYQAPTKEDQDQAEN